MLLLQNQYMCTTNVLDALALVTESAQTTHATACTYVGRKALVAVHVNNYLEDLVVK